MNIILITKKVIIQNLRDKKSMCFAILFPIILICILGTALGSWFSGNEGNYSAEVLYCIDGNSQLGKDFEKSMVKSKTGLDIDYTKTNNITDARNKVASSKYDGFILIKDNKIQLIENGRYHFNAALIENILNVFVQKYNTVLEIAKVNPAALSKISGSIGNGFIEERSLQANKSPRAIDYYAITMLTLIIMYASQGALGEIVYERHGKTQGRILCSSVKKYEYMTSKILGTLIVTMIQVAVIILFSKYALNAYWGNNIPAVLTVVASLIIFSTSIGTGIAYIIKDNNVASTVLSLIIPFLIFLGGGYVPLDMFGSKLITIIAKISPVDWTNRAILNIIYGNDLSTMPYALLINIGLSVVFIAAAALIFRKEEA